jgi:hypothetical protein
MQHNMIMPIVKKNQDEKYLVLDADTLAAVDEGLEGAASNPQRWTPEQVTKD